MEKGYVVENIDATIIAQKPKLRPYIEEMEKNIAKALEISVDQVNVKATTEEKLGFTGSEEGISSQAVCMLASFYESSMAVGGNCAGCTGCTNSCTTACTGCTACTGGCNTACSTTCSGG